MPDQSEIEVLGTKFAINAYPDEPASKATLVEGSILLSANVLGQKKETILRPGQQTLYNHENLTLIPDANVEEATAFARGFFYFSKADIRAVARQLARWYNVEVVYTRPVPVLNFTGKMERSLSLEDVLDILRLNQVEFTVSGNKIIL